MNTKIARFPNISTEQVSLLRSDYYTGYVLDNNFDLHISDSQEMYTVFDSLELAKAYIENIKNLERKYSKVEFTIYDKQQSILYEFIESD